jgi:hypothetical protein
MGGFRQILMDRSKPVEGRALCSTTPFLPRNGRTGPAPNLSHQIRKTFGVRSGSAWKDRPKMPLGEPSGPSSPSQSDRDLGGLSST